MAFDISQQGIAELENDEGFKAHIYLCEAGYWTIGFGHVIRDAHGDMLHGPEMEAEALAHYPSPITRDQGRAILLNDLRSRIVCVNKAIGDVATTQQQFDAMVRLCFNVGAQNFLNSTVLRYHRALQYNRAAGAFLLWDKYHDPHTGKLCESRGLLARRRREMDQYLTSDVAALASGTA